MEQTGSGQIHAIRTHLQRFALTLLLLTISACASQPYPLTSGSHVPHPPPGRFVVWSNHPGVEAYLMSLLLELKQPVVERSRVTKVFDEQKFRLRHTDDDVLRIGKLVGATQVLFADVSGITPSVFWWTEPPPKQSVTLRSIDVQSGQVLWVGSARYLESMAVPDQAVVALTYWALVRALCDGTWEEPTSRNKGGCQTAQAVKTVESRQAEKPEPTIWREMKEMER